eukprot:5868674-Pleurochrysis_carterae.AAC.1
MHCQVGSVHCNKGTAVLLCDKDLLLSAWRDAAGACSAHCDQFVLSQCAALASAVLRCRDVTCRACVAVAAAVDSVLASRDAMRCAGLP